MNKVQVEQKSYEMPPREGFTAAHFLTDDLLTEFPFLGVPTQPAMAPAHS